VSDVAESKKKPPIKIIIIILIFCALGYLFYVKDKADTAPAEVRAYNMSINPGASNNSVPYEILRDWAIGRSGYGMEILVSPNTTQNEVFILARSLVEKHSSKGMFIAMIFDSREAWENRNNDNYPEHKFYLHKLAQIEVPPPASGKMITWTAENRIDPVAR
jgi:hypothetical protein